MRSKAKKILITTETVETITIKFTRSSRPMSDENIGLTVQPQYEVLAAVSGMLSDLQTPSYTAENEIPEIEP